MCMVCVYTYMCGNLGNLMAFPVTKQNHGLSVLYLFGQCNELMVRFLCNVLWLEKICTSEPAQRYISVV